MANNIILAPNQRVLLLQLFLQDQEKLPDAATGKLFRSCLKALGVLQILETANENNDEISTIQARVKTISKFSLSKEQAQYMVDKILSLPKDKLTEIILGDLSDMIVDISNGITPEIPSDIQLFDASSEDWKPPIKDVKGQLIASMAAVYNTPKEKRKEVWTQLCTKFGINQVQGMLDELIDEIRSSI